MGGHPYWYYIDYRADINSALQALRKREFSAGRYNPVMPLVEFPITPSSPAPGAQHDSIEEALEDAEADGTRSILDIFQVSPVPYAEAVATSTYGGMDLFCTTFPLSQNELLNLFGTDKVTHDLVEAVIVESEENAALADQFWESIERGTARHILVYEGDQPREVFFVGYSFD
ncbi:MAG TPA: hypothetical protein V6D07_08525 [Trichocoleus sp.]